MRGSALSVVFCVSLSCLLSSCSSLSGYSSRYEETPDNMQAEQESASANYTSRLPSEIAPPGEKVVIVNPRVHAWGAYSADGTLLRSGLATAGSTWCPDIGRSCRTKVGSFRIHSLGEASCKSHIYPVGKGGAPMPYCMFFNGGQGLHGSPEVVDANASHGCVRMHVDDAEWLRYNFAQIGTRVVVQPY